MWVLILTHSGLHAHTALPGRCVTHRSTTPMGRALMRGLPERRAELERFGRCADASDASRTDEQWAALYASADTRGWLSGFDTAVLPPFAAGARPELALSALERQAGLAPSALRPRPPASKRNRLVSQWALGCQWVLLGLAAYALLRAGLADLAGLDPREAHAWGVSALVVEHALLGSPLTRAAVSALNGAYERKLATHEAGHMLAAYLLGLPVTGYRLLCPSGMPKTAFLHPRLSAEQAAPDGRVTDETLARLSVVLMAGIAAEALDSGRAEGGAADEAMLRALCSRARPEWTARQADDLELWSGCEAVRLLREHRAAHARLADAMRRGAPLGACLAVVSHSIAAGAGLALQPVPVPAVAAAADCASARLS